MGQITADQSQEIMSVFVTGVKWSDIDFEGLDLQNSIIRNKKEACKQFEAFLRNGCRLVVEDTLRNTSDLTITLPALKRPTLEELRKQNSWIKSIERDTSPETPVTLTLATALKPREQSIEGSEYERRLAPKQDVLLGFQHRQWLLKHQDEYPALKALLGKVYIDFPGIVVRDDDGGRGVPCCDRVGSRWGGGWDWLGYGFGDDGRVAVARK